jgi:hypothetical protein
MMEPVIKVIISQFVAAAGVQPATIFPAAPASERIGLNGVYLMMNMFLRK